MEFNRGYFKKGLLEEYKAPFKEKNLEKLEEEHTVRCKNCNARWKEKFKDHISVIAGYPREYEYCDKCKGTDQLK